jgi:hypothetical protein
LNFAAGFFGVRTYESDYHQLVTIEGGGFNNTLAPYFVCPNSFNPAIGGQGTAMATKWINIYLKAATKRLASMITGVDLTVTDVFEMQQTCAYEVSYQASHIISRTERGPF